MRRTVVALCLIAGFFGADVARAEVKVSVFDLESGSASQAVAQRITSLLRKQVANTRGQSIVAGKTLAEIKLIFGCSETPRRAFYRCLAKVGSSLKADQIIVGNARKRGGRHVVSLTLINVDRPGNPRKVTGQLSGDETSGSALERKVRSWFNRLFGLQSTGFVKVSCPGGGVRVTVDGRPAGTCTPGGTRLELPEGKRRLGFAKEGHEPTERVVTVQAGGTTDLEIALRGVEPGSGGVQPGTTGPRPGVTPPPKEDEKKDPTLKWKILFYTTAGAGVAVLVGSIFTGLKVKSLEQEKEDIIRDSWDSPNVSDHITDVNDACSNNRGNQELVNVCNDGARMAAVTNALIGVGAALVAGSGYFLYKAYFDKSGTERQSGDASIRPEAPRLMVSPTFSESGGGVSATLRF